MPSFFFHLVLDLVTTETPQQIQNLSRGIFNTTPNVRQPRTSREGHQVQDINSLRLLNTENSSSEVNVKQEQQAVDVGTGTGGLRVPNTRRECRRTSLQTPTDHDGRYGNIALRKINMLPETRLNSGEKSDHIINGMGTSSNGLATKGRYEPLDLEEEELGWGIVKLYRDPEDTPGLYDDVASNKSSKHGRGVSRKVDTGEAPAFNDEDCTTLCILAVPSYLTPSDFLGFVGEKTREEVSHFRMIRTERINRYMVLMKFRSGKRAREWRKEWNGRAFSSTEVGCFSSSTIEHSLMTAIPSLRTVMSSLSNRSSFVSSKELEMRPLFPT